MASALAWFSALTPSAHGLSCACATPVAHATASSTARTLIGPIVLRLLDGRRLRRLRRCSLCRAVRSRRLHEGAALEDHALVDLKLRRVEVALDATGRVDLDRALRRDIADDGALDDHVADVDLRLDVRAFADHERVVGEYLALEATIDSDRAFERELALERRSTSEQGRDLTGRRLSRCCLHHGIGSLSDGPLKDRADARGDVEE